MANMDRLAKFRKKAAHEETPASPTVDVHPESAPEPEINDSTTKNAADQTVDMSRPRPAGWCSPTYDQSRTVKLVPEITSANRCIAFAEQPQVVDAYKVLRTQILQKMQLLGGNTLMVTSALPGDGKTTTAINLAFTMAKEFQQTVLLVDCDLQQQDVHKQLGYKSDRGLIDYLLDDCPVSELFTWPGIEKISVVSGGRLIRESSELLGSPRMKELVSDMKLRYPARFVIFDMQSISAGADALVFAQLVDHIIMVVQEGKTPVSEIKRSVEMLPEGKLLGMMLNRHKIDTRPIKNPKTYVYQ
jgi:non-specific protein-tyrosine kinase